MQYKYIQTIIIYRIGTEAHCLYASFPIFMIVNYTYRVCLYVKLYEKGMVFGLGLNMNGEGVFKVRPARPIYTFLSSPFPRVKRWQEPFVRVEDPKVEHDQVEPLTFLGQLFNF